MIIEPVANPFFYIPTGIVVIWDFLTLPLFFKWVKSGDFLKIRWLVLTKPISTIICIYFLFTQFGGGTFLGAMYWLNSLVVAFIMFILFIIQAIRLRKELGYKTKNYIPNLLLGLTIVISLTVPAITYQPIKDGCADSNSKNILIISKALEDYYSEYNNYPKNLDELAPSFLNSIPSPACTLLSGLSNPFILNTCNPENPYIHIRTLDGVGFEYYSLKDGSRTRQHSFLDGGPSYCP